MEISYYLKLEGSGGGWGVTPIRKLQLTNCSATLLSGGGGVGLSDCNQKSAAH